MSVEIRKALASDVDDLAAIENAVFPGDRISRRSFRKLIERETAEALVAVVEGRVAGYAIVLFRKGSAVARLYSIATASAFSGRGVGRLLLEAAEDAAFEHDRMMLRLEVREDNARAIAIYERAGYRYIGREPDYYEDGATALRYEVPGCGFFGVIANESVPFCRTCSRLRLSSTGWLHGCLSSSNRHYVGDLLDKPRHQALPALQRLLVKALADKQEVAFSGGVTVMKIIGG